MAFFDVPSNPTTGTVYVETTEITHIFDGIKWISVVNNSTQGEQGTQEPQGLE